MGSAGYRDHPIKAGNLNSNFIGAPFTYEGHEGEDVIGRISRIILHRGGKVWVYLEGAPTSEDEYGVLKVDAEEIFRHRSARRVLGVHRPRLTRRVEVIALPGPVQRHGRPSTREPSPSDPPPRSL